MQAQATIKTKLEIQQVKAIPREGMTLDELESKMRGVGNEILEKNVEGNYLIIKHNG